MYTYRSDVIVAFTATANFCITKFIDNILQYYYNYQVRKYKNKSKLIIQLSTYYLFISAFGGILNLSLLFILKIKN